MAAAAVAASVEDNIRTLVQTKRIRVNEFFQDYDKLRSGFVTAPQFFRCLWQSLSLKLSEEEERALYLKYRLQDNSQINYKQFCNAIDLTFNPQNVTFPPEVQTQVPIEYLGTIRTQRFLSEDSETRLAGILQRLQQYYKVRGINLRNQYEDFDKHHKGVISESQFYRNFLGPENTDEEDMRILVEKYGVPDQPGLVNYLNLHNDIIAMRKCLDTAKDPGVTFRDRNIDFIPLFPSADPSLAEVLEKINVAVYKNGIRIVDFFKDHDKLRSGAITENQFVCGLALACSKSVTLQRPEIQKVAEFYRLPDGRINYRDFCEVVENAFNVPHLEKRPTETVQRPGKGSLFRGLKPLNNEDEEKVKRALLTIGDKVSKERIMMYQYFRDFDRSNAYTRVITPTQFARILHFLGLKVNNEEMKLILSKFQDPATGDVNYPAFVQAVDRGYVGHVMDSKDTDVKLSQDKIQAKDQSKTTLVESSPVQFEELMARIRHIVLVNRVRVIDYFQDYDLLKSGCISTSQFRRGLALMGLSKLGHHDLNENQFNMLVEHYQNPDKPGQILWTKFHQDVESVFTLEGLKKIPSATVTRQEMFRVPKPGTVDWNKASKHHMDIYLSAMDRIRKRVEQRRILCRPVFHDFDKHNNGHITRNQFQQSFRTLDIPVEEQDINALEALYSNDLGINYQKFLSDLQPSEPVPFMYVQRMEELRQVNARKASSEHTGVTDLESVMLKIKTKVCKERIRVYEFMKDHDKLRSGRMSKNLFRRALDMAQLNLLESDIAVLEDKYQSAFDCNFVDYLPFIQEVESVFTKDHLEKFPVQEVQQFKPDKEWDLNKLSAEDEDKTRKCMLRIAEKVYNRRMQLFPLFEDYDRVHNGTVSRSQFRRVLAVLELNQLLNDEEIQLLWKRFQAMIGGREDVNYIAFCKCINELAGFDINKP